MRFDYFAHLDGPQSYRDVSGRMILCKGGSSSSDDGGAERREKERQARIKAGTDAVNSIFGYDGDSPTITVPVSAAANQIAFERQNTGNFFNDLLMNSASAASRISSGFGEGGTMQIANPGYAAAQKRKALYDATREDARAFYAKQLDEDREKAARDLRFHAARQGIIGSSQANDFDAEFQKRYDRGLIDVANRSDSAATNLRTSDEQARLSLISKIVAGLDQGTATQNALSSLQTNAEAAQQAAQQGRMANVFADMLGGYNQYQYGQGMQDARNSQRGTNGNFFTSDQSISGTVSRDR